MSTRRTCSSAPGSTAPSDDDVLVEIERTAGSPRVETPGRATRRRAPGTRPAARPHHPRPGELPQPRLPPRAARADPARAGDVLDLARADVRRRRAARPGLLLRAGPGDLPRDGRRPGITAVGEFHYLHHQPDGTPYDDPNAMGDALVEAARQAGMRIALLDTCYLSQRVREAARGRAGALLATATPTAWAARAGRRPGGDPLGAGGAARPAARSSTAGRRCTCTSPSRWPRTRPASRRTASPRPGCCTRRTCSARTRRSCTRPTSPTTTSSCSAPPAPTSASRRPPSATSPTASARPRGCAQAGCRITLGSDSHAVIDPFEEMRGLEMDERLATQRARPLDRRRAARRGDRPREARLRGRRRDRGRPARRPGHPRHRQPAHRRHRRRRAHRGVRGHGGRRRPGRRGRPGRVHAAATRPRSGASSTRRSEHCGQHPDHPHRRAGRPTTREMAVRTLRRRSLASYATPRWSSRAAGSPGSGRADRGAGRRRGRRRRRPRGAARASSTATATWSSPATGPRSSRPGWPASPTPPAASAPPSPPPARPPTSSSPPTSPGWSRRCAGRAPRPSRSSPATG